MKNLFWRLIANVVTWGPIRDRLIKRALRTPYFHLTGYMNRYWLFNPTDRTTKRRRWSWIPFAIRVHHIVRRDEDPHEHNHPWEARTIILDGWYVEQRNDSKPRISLRETGYTGVIGSKQFHKILDVSPGGVWTMFIMYKFKGVWGFYVSGKFIPYSEYENKREES